MIWLHYIYVHRSNSGEIYYVGQGVNQAGQMVFGRAYSRNFRSKLWHQTVKARGLNIEVICSCKNEEAVYEAEKYFIKFFGRKDRGGVLINQTDGGRGKLGYITNAETRQKLSRAFTGRKLTPECKAKISKFFKGRKRIFSEDHRRAIGLAGRGRRHSDATRLKMSLSHDRKPRFTGKHSEETKAKMRAGQRAYQERRRISNEI